MVSPVVCPHADCDCYAGGTEGNACRKDPRVGMCVCKPNFQGTHCDQCAPGHYGPSCQREYPPGSVPKLALLGFSLFSTHAGEEEFHSSTFK